MGWHIGDWSIAWRDHGSGCSTAPRIRSSQQFACGCTCPPCPYRVAAGSARPARRRRGRAGPRANGDAVFATDLENRITFWTPSAERLFGYPAAEAVGRPFGERVPREWLGRSHNRRARQLGEALAPEPACVLLAWSEHVMASRRSSARPTVEATTEPVGELERAVIDNLYDGVYYVDRGRRIRYWNRGAERLSGYLANDVVGRFCYDNILSHVDASGRSLCRSVCPLARTMRDGEPREAEIFLRHREGHRVPIQVRTAPVRDREGAVIGGIEIFEDATRLSAVRREVSELRDQAMHDALTGLPNRRHFEMTMASRIAELAGYGRPFGLLIADIDRFKRVNDRYGHATGDVALRTVARTLLASSRPGDQIARVGGEEFALTITDVDLATLRPISERFRAMVAQTRVHADELDLRIRISIGGTMAEPGDTMETIYGRADVALYAAKNAGRNRVCLSGDAGASTA